MVSPHGNLREKERQAVDFQALNTHAFRETHHTQFPFHQARCISNGKRKTVFDGWNGYNSVPLHEDDPHKTTFITPWGRYRYLSTPQIYIASGDSYTRRYHEIVADIGDKTKCVDDMLLWSDTIDGSYLQAGYMWPEWNRPQPRDVRIQRTHNGLCRLHDHHD